MRSIVPLSLFTHLKAEKEYLKPKGEILNVLVSFQLFKLLRHGKPLWYSAFSINSWELLTTPLRSDLPAVRLLQHEELSDLFTLFVFFRELFTWLDYPKYSNGRRNVPGHLNSPSWLREGENTANTARLKQDKRNIPEHTA